MLSKFLIMATLTQKSVVTPRLFTFSYYIQVSPSSTKPTLLFLHGWPDSALVWLNLISTFGSLGYGIIAPDLLGYGGSSKPTSPSHYNSAGICSDLIHILDDEHVSQVIAIGHDWGTLPAYRLPLYYPDRVTGVISTTIAYSPPAPFDFATLKAYFTKTLGKPLLAYWDLLIANQAPSLLEDHAASLFDCLHARAIDGLGDVLAVENGLRQWLESDRHEPTKAYATPAMRDAFVERVRRDGMAGPLCWYRAAAENLHWEMGEKDLPKERYVLEIPVLYVGCERDTISPPGVIEGPKGAGLLPDLTVKVIDSGHWVMMEKPGELESVLKAWLLEKFPV